MEFLKIKNFTFGFRLSVFLVTNAGLSYLTSEEVGGIILIFRL